MAQHNPNQSDLADFVRYGGKVAKEIVSLIGRDGACRLAEHYGGRRVYIPLRIEEAISDFVENIGSEAAEALSDVYGRDFIKVPLYRELRAVHYRSQQFQNPEIARRLGMTEAGVDKLFFRLRSRKRLASTLP